MRVIRVFFILFTMGCCVSLATATTLHLPETNSEHQTYIKSVVRQALIYGLKDQPTLLIHSPVSVNNGLEALKKREVSLTWASQAELNALEDKSQFEIVNIPLFMGLMSYYDLIFHKPSVVKGKAKAFEEHEIAMLETDMLAAPLMNSGHKIIRVRSMKNLVNMLDKQRFDAILAPSSLLAGIKICETHPTPRRTLKLHNPWFLVVAKNNKKLARALSAGLQKMLKNGDFNVLIQQTPTLAVLKAHVQEHKIIAAELEKHINISYL